MVTFSREVESSPPPANRRWGHEPSYADVIKSWFYSNLVTHDRSLWQVESINNKKNSKDSPTIGFRTSVTWRFIITVDSQRVLE